MHTTRGFGGWDGPTPQCPRYHSHQMPTINMHVRIIIKIESTFNLLGKGLHIELHNHLLPNSESYCDYYYLPISTKFPAKEGT